MEQEMPSTTPPRKDPPPAAAQHDNNVRDASSSDTFWQLHVSIPVGSSDSWNEEQVKDYLFQAYQNARRQQQQTATEEANGPSSTTSSSSLTTQRQEEESVETRTVTEPSTDHSSSTTAVMDDTTTTTDTDVPTQEVTSRDEDGREQTVQLVGSNRERALCIIPSPRSSPERTSQEDDDEQDRLLIKEINSILSKRGGDMRRVTQNAQSTQRQDGESIRKIQSGRYEIFVKGASGHPTRYFDDLIRRERQKPHYDGVLTRVGDVTERLTRYAVKQALRDPRLAGREWDFQNFSLICSFGRADAQHEHVDMLPPNYQFLLCLTEDSPATYFYNVDESDTVRTVPDLQRLWEREQGDDFPTNLATLIENSEDASTLLGKFGDVFHPHAYFQRRVKKHPKIRSGTLLSLPGGVVHAGPQTEGFRAVLFFSATPADQTAVRYNPDAQYNNVVLTGLFILLLWRVVGVTFADRLYLLRRLAAYIQQADVNKEWEDHFLAEKGLHRFIHRVRTAVNAKELDGLLKQTAARDDFVWYHTQSADLKGDYAWVSNVNLCTERSDHVVGLRVYKRKQDGRVLLEFLGGNKVVWDGGADTKRYTLEMQQGPTDEKFDGSNGILRDNDGNEIQCFLQTPAERRNRKKRSRPETAVGGVSGFVRPIAGNVDGGPPGKTRRQMVMTRSYNDDWDSICDVFRRDHAKDPDGTWLEQFKMFLEPLVSGSNFQSTVRQVESLVNGSGISHPKWPEGVSLHKGQTIDLSTDFTTLLRQADALRERYEDKTNGKLMHIPIRKLRLFQRHYFEQQLEASPEPSQVSPKNVTQPNDEGEGTVPRSPKYAIGTTFVKEFPGFGTFLGRIVSFHADNDLYHVYYPKDGDTEDLIESDLMGLKILSRDG